MNGKIVKEWINKAEQDYMTAKVLIRQRKISVYDVICFHCHQCIEKYIKAYLTFKNTRFPKTHDLVILLNLSSSIDGSFQLINDLIKLLNEFAVQFRYPGEEAHKKEAKLAMKCMEEIRKFVQVKFE